MAFEVIGDWDDDELDGDVLGDDFDEDDLDGDVLGYSGPMSEADEIVGYDDDGIPIVGARRRRRGRRRSRGRRLVRARRPGWRRRQLAPGVIAPDQGRLPLPLIAANSNTFDLNNQVLTFEGQVQKPFRGERLLVSTVRTGTSAVGRLIGQLFIGTDLQQLDVGGFDLEQVGDPNAFGVRLTMKPCQPGVFIRIPTTLTNAITTTDNIVTTITLLGRNVH